MTHHLENLARAVLDGRVTMTVRSADGSTLDERTITVAPAEPPTPAEQRLDALTTKLRAELNGEDDDTAEELAAYAVETITRLVDERNTAAAAHTAALAELRDRMLDDAREAHERAVLAIRTARRSLDLLDSGQPRLAVSALRQLVDGATETPAGLIVVPVPTDTDRAVIADELAEHAVTLRAQNHTAGDQSLDDTATVLDAAANALRGKP